MQLVAGIVSFPSLSYTRVPRQRFINNSKRFPINSPPLGISAGFLQNGERPKTCSPWKREAGVWVQLLAAQSSLQLLFLDQPRSPEGPRCLGNQRGSVNVSLLPKENSNSRLTGQEEPRKPQTRAISALRPGPLCTILER